LDPPSGLDESAGLAGWLYTDLLLGLLVVFLGGVAFFVPQITQDDGEAATTSTSAPASTSTTSVEQSGTLIPTTVPVPMCVALGGEDQITRVTLSRSWSDEQLVAEAEAQIQFGFAERGISADASVGFAIAFGGPEIRPGAGRARDLIARLQLLMPDRLGLMRYRAYGDQALNQDTVNIDLFPLTEAPCP